MSFVWTPGRGPNEDALTRLRTYLSRPPKPMGEAWFMSKERKLHQELFSQGAGVLPLRDLLAALEDVSSGTNAFGHLEEWDIWLPYLLADLVLRSHEQYIASLLLEDTITAFMAVYWTSIREEYPGFSRDVGLTLGNALMKPELWVPDPEAPADPTRQIPAFLSRETGARDIPDWGSSNAPESLAAAMAFCLKYLSLDELHSWARALFTIEHPRWRFAVLVWYVGAYSLRTQSSVLARDYEKAAPRITWHNFHLLKTPSSQIADADLPLTYNHAGAFLASARLAAVLDALRGQLTVERLAEWEAAFWQDPILASDPALPSILDRALTTLAA